LLRGDPYLDRGYDWDDVINLAQTARGRDEFGWRAEFLQLARAASSAAALNPLPQQPRPEPDKISEVRPHRRLSAKVRALDT
jgi:hypothetical protein